VQVPHDWAPHVGFGNAVVSQYGRLSGGGCGPVASHGGEDERAHSLVLKELRHVAHDGGDVVDAAAAGSDGDARSGFHAPGESGTGKLLVNLGGDVGNASVRKLLADDE